MTQRGRQKIGAFIKAGWPGAARVGLVASLVLLVTGCVGTVSPGYVGEPYYDPYYSYYPYDYGPYYGDVYIGGYPYYHHYYGREYSHRGIDGHYGYYGRHAEASHAVPHAGGFSGSYRGQGHGSSHDHR